jgi:Predicted periplasmic lipoprotein (DUF2279)
VTYNTKFLKKIISIFLFIISFQLFGQDSISLSKNRLNYVVTAHAVVYSATMTGLYQLWYKDYDHSSFHFFDDSDEWLQMDKIGHTFSSYYVNEFCYETFNWAGLESKKNVLLSSGIGLLYISTIELFDGFSSEWGASVSDFGANVFGVGLYSSQQYFWNEQRIIPKFSFHQTNFPNYRPDVLGENFIQQWFKDYNGQTYWLSMNLDLLLPERNIPECLNLAIGYSATGLVGGTENPRVYENEIIPVFDRQRQYYISLDVDLTKIKTKSKFLNTCFKAFNIFKIPFPAIEYSNGFKFKPLYF